MNSKFSIDQNIGQSNLDSINTQVLYPISISQNEATIIIPNRGGSLDKNSAIVLPATVNENSCFLPINTGIASLLDSVSLLCNGQVIAQNTEPGQYITMSNCFMPQEYRDSVLRCRSGIREVYDMARTGQLNIATGNTYLTKPGKITLKDLQYEANANHQGASDAGLDSFAGNLNAGVGNANYRLTDNAATTANYYLYLEQLFPKLYGSLQLPVYLIEGELSLVIKFSSNNSAAGLNERVLNRSTRVTAAAAVSCEILTDDVVLLTDYLVPTMEAKNALVQQVMSDQGLVLSYGDLLFNNFLVKGLPAASTTGIRNYKRDIFQLGLSNKVVRQLYMMFTPTQNYGLSLDDSPYHSGAFVNSEQAYSQYNSINALKGKYCSKVLSYLPDGEKVQINFNSKNIFNTPLETSGQKLHELQSAYGASFCMPSNTYDFKDMVVDKIDTLMYPPEEGRLFYPKSITSFTESAQGYSLQNLVGQNHYLGVNLQKPVLTPDNRLIRMNVSGSGTRCGSVPVEIQIDRLCNRGEADDDRNLIVAACVEKTMQIKNGQIFIEYS